MSSASCALRVTAFFSSPSTGGAAGHHTGKKLPDWFAEAPMTLDRLVAEQRHQDAVDLIKKVKVYADANKDLASTRHISQYTSKCIVTLANKLRSSINKLPNSQLWVFHLLPSRVL